jgi:hypothetical protein
MLRTVIAALLVAYLPGALVYRVPRAQRPLRAALPAEERAFWAVVLSVCWSLTVVMALAALDRYQFPYLLLTNTLVSIALLVGFRGKLGYGGAAPTVHVSALAPAGLIVVGALLYFPASEYIIGGKDPGTYLNEGVQIAQRGSLVALDPIVPSVPAASRDLFFPWHQNPFYFSTRFMGFFIQDPSSGKVVGQFPHLFPASIAIAYELNGLTGARNTVGVWALLGLVAVYLVGARLFGRPAAVLACALLAINVIQIWFARYPNSETVMQTLVFAALLAFARATEGSRLFFGTIAGGLLGLMLFLRYDAVLAMAAFAAAAALMPSDRRAGAAFVVALVATGLCGLWYLANPMMAYSEYPLRFTRERGGWALVGAGLVAIAIFRWIVRTERVAATIQRTLPIALAVVMTVLAIYAYFFRDEGGLTAVHDAMAFRTFAWYITPWALGAAVIGLAVLLVTRFWHDPAFFLTFATFSLFFFYKTRIVPEHFWASRRFLAVILPGVLLVLAGAASVVVDRWLGVARSREVRPRDRPFVAVLVIAGLLTPLGIAFWRASAPVRSHVEYEGLIAALEKLAGSLGPRDLLIVESRDAGSDLHVLALPLAYIYSKNVLVLASAAPAKRALENFVSWAETTYDRVLFLGGGGTDLLSRHLSARFLEGDRFQVKQYDARINEYPQGVRRKDLEFGLYRLSRQVTDPTGPRDVPIGKDDDLNVVRFHARERDRETGLPYRWSGPQSFVLILGIAPDARRLIVWMGDGGRPRQAPPAEVEVALADQPLGSALVAGPVRAYEFPLSPDLAAQAASSDDPVRLRLRTRPWVPALVLGGEDARELGVVVTRVQVQ